MKSSVKKGARRQASWGFDVRELASDIRPQDDFFGYVNRRWIDRNPIPATESRWGTFVKLRFDVEKQLKVIVDELLKKDSPKGTPERMVGDFYRAAADRSRRNQLGAAPLAPLLTAIDGLATRAGLTAVLAKLHRVGTGGFFGLGVDQDAKDSERYRLYLWQGGLGMPDREYYLKTDAESTRVRDAYRVHVEKMFRLLGSSPVAAATQATAVLQLETALARCSMKKEDLRDPHKTYHRMTVAQITKRAPTLDWARYLRASGAGAPPFVIVGQPEFLVGLDRLLAESSIPALQAYLRFHVANDFAGALSDPFVKQSFSFYSAVLAGTKTMKPLWRRALAATNANLGELLGRIYVERHFPPAAKKRMQILVEDLLEAYEARLRTLDWMGSATKRRALSKLRALNRKIGYPDRWRLYTGLRIDPTDYVGNLIRAEEFEHARAMKRLAKPIDRAEWFMYPQTVNAYFAPTMNDIVFPAAILQPPFFDLAADDALNYGAIGAVIAHEITHGFDDEGSKFDATGNLKHWWTAEDRKRFDAKGKRVQQQFSRYRVADGLSVNGKLTLGENIADLGGLVVAYDAYQLQLARTGRVDIDGLTPEQRFFIAFAVFEREHSRSEMQKLQVLNDPHAPGIFRINGPVSNFTPFYEAFGVKKGDALYRPPASRETVW